MDFIKPVIKGIEIDRSIQKKINVIVNLICDGLSDSELNTLESIIKHSSNNTLFITPIVSKYIQDEFGITSSSFSTSLHRLEKKGIIKRSGKTVMIHPYFKDIASLDKLVISFR